jgi:hypothetical protein
MRALSHAARSTVIRASPSPPLRPTASPTHPPLFNVPDASLIDALPRPRAGRRRWRLVAAWTRSAARPGSRSRRRGHRQQVVDHGRRTFDGVPRPAGAAQWGPGTLHDARRRRRDEHPVHSAHNLAWQVGRWSLPGPVPICWTPTRPSVGRWPRPTWPQRQTWRRHDQDGRGVRAWNKPKNSLASRGELEPCRTIRTRLTDVSASPPRPSGGGGNPGSPSGKVVWVLPML